MNSLEIVGRIGGVTSFNLFLRWIQRAFALGKKLQIILSRLQSEHIRARRLKMFEYLASGRPVIASRLPGLVREFEHSSGVVNVDIPNEAIDMAVKLSKDSELMNRLSAQALPFIKNRPWEEITKTFENVLTELVHQRN